MRMMAKTIVLGDRSWLVRPLTISQVQAIEPLLSESSDRGTIAAAVAILSIALARDHAEAAETLETIEAAAPEIAAAMAEVLRLGGFLPGEAGAGQERTTPWPASIGPSSTPA